MLHSELLGFSAVASKSNLVSLLQVCIQQKQYSIDAKRDFENVAGFMLQAQLLEGHNPPGPWAASVSSITASNARPGNVANIGLKMIKSRLMFSGPVQTSQHSSRHQQHRTTSR
jgi:hypothetical protein